MTTNRFESLPRWAACLALGFILVLPDPARSSDVTREMGLKEALAQAQWVCLAEYLGPDPKIKAASRFRVIETLMDRNELSKGRKEIRVVTPRAVANARARAAHAATGVHRSPLLYRLDGGMVFPGSKGAKGILLLKEHDEQVFVLVAADAMLPEKQREKVSGELTPSSDLFFVGRVESIQIAPLAGSRNNYVVKTRVLQVKQGAFSGKHFEFRIHSPRKSRIKAGEKLEVRAKAIEGGFFVDPLQFLER